MSGRIAIVEGDLTEQEVDAVVNAANARLQLGAGVAGAILQKGGEAIQRECDALAPVEVGQAVVTSAGALPAGAVIHAAVMAEPGGAADERTVRAALRSALQVAAERGCRTVAAPALGTGVGGFSMERCAEVSLEEARRALDAEGPLEEVRFVLLGEPAYRMFERVHDRARIAAQMERLRQR